MKPISLCMELDSIPERLFSRARDWSEVALSRLLVHPLFIEADQGSFVAGLTDEYRRLDDLTWEVALREDARWHSGEPVTAADMCHGILLARAHGGAARLATGLFSAVQPVNARTLRLSTRQPIGDIRPPLSHPGFAPQRTGSSCGPFRAEVDHNRRLRIESADGRTQIELIAARSERRGTVDISGPMPSPAHWTSWDEHSGAQSRSLGIWFVLQPPDNAGQCSEAIREAVLSRDLIVRESCGYLRSALTFSEAWIDQPKLSPSKSTDATARESSGQRIHLVTANYPLNRWVAERLAEQLGSNGVFVQIETRPYSADNAWLSGSVNSYRLLMLATPWSHPAAPLLPYYFGASAPPEFAQSLRDCLAANSRDDAIRSAARAERALSTAGMMPIVLCQVVGRLASALPSHLPFSGWISLATIARESDL